MAKRKVVVFDCSGPACDVRDVPPPLTDWLVVIVVAGETGHELFHFHALDCLTNWSVHEAASVLVGQHAT